MVVIARYSYYSYENIPLTLDSDVATTQTDSFNAQKAVHNILYYNILLLPSMKCSQFVRLSLFFVKRTAGVVESDERGLLGPAPQTDGTNPRLPCLAQTERLLTC